MESFTGDTEESTEDVGGHKKSKLKSLKTRLFGRSKKAGGEEDAKLSQSASDITAGKGLGSDEDLTCSQGVMGSRAVSHDSIFLADQDLTDAEPARVLSQENVHSKIKALQIKLQQQKMHLGPPPLVLPVKRPEDDGPPHRPPEALSTTTSLSPVTLTPSLPLLLSISSNSTSSAAELPLDFSSPAQFTPCLDTSAARHRMSVKPRNQRASTKKTLVTNDHKSGILNNIHHPEPEREEQQQLSIQEEAEQGADVKSPEVAPIASEAVSVKSSGLVVSQLDQASHGTMPSAPSQLLRVKPHRAADVTLRERPHSSFIPSEVRDSETQLTSHDKRITPNKAGMTEVSSTCVKASSVQKQVLETESIRGIKKPSPGAGSFHFSITSAKHWEAERPRSSSFVEVLESKEARHKAVRGTEDKPFSGTRDREKVRGGPVAVGRLRPEGAPLQSSALWDRRDSLTARGAAQGESNQEAVEEAVEAHEAQGDEGKMAFGVKLRSTALSPIFRPDSSSKPQECEEQCDQVKRQGGLRDVRLTGPVPSGLALPVRQNTPGDPQIMETHTTSSDLKGVETAIAAPRGPEPASQTASSEVSWMSLAMEKTRSLQQLFSSRFPRDFTAVQTSARPQAQVPTETPAGAQPLATQAVRIQQSTAPLEANQPSSDAVKAETVQNRGQVEAQQQPPWSQRGPHPNNQLKPAASTTSSAPPPASAPGRGEREAAIQETEGPALSGRRAVWAGSVSDRAAFLERRAEWSNPPGSKGVELKKAQAEVQTSEESPDSVKSTTHSKNMKPEERPGVKLPESNPTKIPERPREDRWLRKTVASSSSPSSSPIIGSVLQSEVSGSGQPSWMELAKRKSMAWSDKSMD